MAITHNYVDFGAGNDTTGDGSITTPWKTLQKAFDTLTRNTTDGNQVNLKAGTAHVNTAALDLATFVGGGALSATAPLIVRGYTTAANDGGVGEIDCGGFTMWAATTYDYIILADLEVHTFGNNNGIVLDDYCMLYRCEAHKGASSPSGKNLVSLDLLARVFGCYIHDQGTNGTCLVCASAFSHVHGNYILAQISGTGMNVAGESIGNIVLCTATSIGGISCGAAPVIGNIVYNTTASTSRGISSGASSLSLTVKNNIICGYSGVAGTGVFTNSDIGVVGYNAFWNNTAAYSIGDQRFIDLTTNDVALAADPFTDAANGDFSLTEAGKAALRSLGWPPSYLGAHANTDPHITIGAMQYGPTPAASGGGRRPRLWSLS